jgi:hypothetical protein
MMPKHTVTAVLIRGQYFDDFFKTSRTQESVIKDIRPVGSANDHHPLTPRCPIVEKQEKGGGQGRPIIIVAAPSRTRAPRQAVELIEKQDAGSKARGVDEGPFDVGDSCVEIAIAGKQFDNGALDQGNFGSGRYRVHEEGFAGTRQSRQNASPINILPLKTPSPIVVEVLDKLKTP